MMKSKIILLALIIAFACHSPEKKVNTDFYTTTLFNDVQNQAIFPDSKTFVDCATKRPLQDILREYETEKGKPGFDLKKFIEDNFEPPYRPTSGFVSDSLQSMEVHINNLWPVLTRKPDQYNSNSTLLPLPRPYIVPGGRF